MLIQGIVELTIVLIAAALIVRRKQTNR